MGFFMIYMLDIKKDILPLKNIMFRLALRITMSREEAEDVVQDVVIKLWNNRENLDNVENLEAYAMRMVRNTAISQTRLHVNQTESLDVVSNRPLSDDDNEDKAEKLQSIKSIMATLPEKQRTAMQLRDFEGYSYKEISTMMDITEDQVKINIYRARQQIKSKLTDFNT